MLAISQSHAAKKSKLTGHGDSCAVRCEESELLTVGDQNYLYSAKLERSSAVLR